MQIGFEVATRHGLTLGLWDLSLSPSSIRGRARRLLQEAMTASDERSREVAQKAAWDSLAPPTTVGLSNPVAVMFQSGARGNAKQLGQLVGVRGFMSPANGSGVFSHFVASNLVEGHHPLGPFSVCTIRDGAWRTRSSSRRRPAN